VPGHDGSYGSGTAGAQGGGDVAVGHDPTRGDRANHLEYVFDKLRRLGWLRTKVIELGLVFGGGVWGPRRHASTLGRPLAQRQGGHEMVRDVRHGSSSSRSLGWSPVPRVTRATPTGNFTFKTVASTSVCDCGVSTRRSDAMRHVGLFIARVVFGVYLAVHGAQKLFGAFGGGGLGATAKGFAGMGIRPSKPMAALAGASELGGGVLTATGIADPLGPLMVAGTMAVASTVHRKQGPLAQNGGFELPLTNLAMSIALMSSGTGALRLGPHLSRRLVRLSLVAGVSLAAVSIAQLLRPSAPTAAPVVDEAAEADEVELGDAA